MPHGQRGLVHGHIDKNVDLEVEANNFQAQFVHAQITKGLTIIHTQFLHNI